MEQKDNNVQSLKDSFKTKENLCRYVFLKTEKLTSALYLVTDFLSDKEPLKWKLREISLNLVFDANSLSKDKKDFFGIAGLSRLSFEINNLILLLDVAYIGGAVSQMNFEILKQEYQNLLDLINTGLNENSLKRFISDESLNLVNSNNSLAVQNSSTANMTGRSASHSLGFASPLKKDFSLSSPKAENRLSIGQKDTRKDSVNDLYGLNSKTAKKSLRKEQIINFLKDKNWTGINEISKALPDCGAKTVQRELLEMVSLNILKKQGERRWSRYMLI